MSFEFISFWLRETVSNIARNRLMSIVAITTTTVGLFILGAFFLTISNLRAAVDKETHKLDIVVLLKADITPARRKQIYNAARIPQVKDLQFASKSQVLREMKKDLPDIPVGDFKNDNPLKDELRIKLHNPEDIFKVQSYLGSIKGVQETRRDDESVRMLLHINSLLAVIGVVSLLMLGMAILLIISNAIRLTIFARRREIRIMEMVGATAWFIRIPFLLEGMIYGVMGAAVAAVVLGALWLMIARNASNAVKLVLPLTQDGTVLYQCVGIILAAGLVFGLVGSWASLNRSLNKAVHV